MFTHTRLMCVAHVQNVARVDVVVQRVLDQLLRLVARQLRHSVCKTDVTCPTLSPGLDSESVINRMLFARTKTRYA